MDDVYSIRASSFSELFDCPLRWATKYLLDQRLPTTGRAHLGTSVHAGTAAFDKAQLDGDPISVDEAVDITLDTLRNAESEVSWEDIDTTYAERVGALLTARYCNDIAPHYEFEAVEERCQSVYVTEDHWDGIVIELTGHIDRRIVRRDSHGDVAGRGIGDIKTGGQAVMPDGSVNMQLHGAQLATYELLEIMAGKTTGIEINLPATIIGMNTKTGLCGAQSIDQPYQVLLGTPESPGMLDHAASMFKTGMYHGNPRSMLCNPKYCPAWTTCKWRFGDPVETDEFSPF